MSAPCKMGIALVGSLSRVRQLEPYGATLHGVVFSNRADRHRVRGEAISEGHSGEAQAAEPDSGCDLGTDASR